MQHLLVLKNAVKAKPRTGQITSDGRSVCQKDNNIVKAD